MTYNNFPKFSESKIIIHIAFHYNEERFEYLRGVISSILDYNFNRVDIYIDTNVDNFDTGKLGLDLPENIGLKIIPHQNLEHPFLLTWQHRKNIISLKNEYDYFMYLEDDISVTYEALRKWREDSVLLYKYGKIRGFIRCEENNDHEIVSTDYLEKIKCNQIGCFGGKIFFKPKNPYQGFWVYSKEQINKFIESMCWHDGNCDWEVRERASAGMIWLDNQRHNLVVPIQKSNIPDYVFVKHLPNNYAMDTNNKHGTIKTKELMPKNTLCALYIRLIEYLCHTWK